MNKAIDKILIEISSRHNLKLTLKHLDYRLEDSMFDFRLQYHNEILVYWINNKYGLISYFFAKRKIETVINELKEFCVSEKIIINKLI